MSEITIYPTNKASKEQWLGSLKAGDIGLIYSNNFFAVLQNLERKKFKEGAEKASHGFVVEDPPNIAEANGLFVSRATVIKNIGDKTKCWIFRNDALGLADLDDMKDYIAGAVDSGGHYSIGGIMQFGLQFLGLRKKLHDESGVFCTEFSSRAIMHTDLPYIKDRPAYAITPSYQLNWLLGPGMALGWLLEAYYDGAGGYYIR